MSDEYDDLTIEELLRDVDVQDNVGVFWTLVGAASLLSLFVITALWRLVKR